MIIWNRTALGLVITLLVGCQRSLIKPIAIAPEDVCSFCKMAISEKRYAGQYVDKDGQAFKFDDLTCMTSFNEGSNIAASFVMDFEAKQWLKAEDAIYVRSSELKTPMSGGMIAFKDEAPAEQASRNYHGKLLRFGDVFSRQE